MDSGPRQGRAAPAARNRTVPITATRSTSEELRLRADHQPARATRPPRQDREDQGPGDAQELEQPAPAPGVDPGRAPEAGRLPAGPDDDAQEAELGPPEDRPRAPDEPDGGHGLHPRHRP